MAQTAGPLAPVMPQQAMAASATAAPEAAKPKSDKGKLTDLHGEPPLIIKRNENGHLNRGRMLGEGGFARVYAATDSISGQAKAVKIISKEQLKSSKTKAKLFAEIKLHQVMDHPNIIKFECCFEDSGNVYMQLELCGQGSMLDWLRKRKRFTEGETRFYLTQLIGAAQYMHTNCVIHRDLKLGNLMVDANMNLKVGDFGLAALVKFPGERKKTICGTPNYIAPEILFDQSTGHSFEADIWSVGVIIYTMLFGKPPFQTKDIKAIYKKIKALDYTFPSNVPVSDPALELVEAILDREPQNRPSAAQILNHPFLYSGPFPRSIPTTAAEHAPDFSMLSESQSQRNFAYVQRAAGASLHDDDEAAVASNPTIPEEGETSSQLDARREQRSSVAPPEPPTGVVAMSSGANVIAQEMAIEREVKKALDPGSPISELLKSARKPLMVSPRALAAQREKEKNEVARRVMSAGVNAARQIERQGAEKENVQRATMTRSSKSAATSSSIKEESGKEGETGLENAVRALRVSSNQAASPSRLPMSASTASIREKRKAPSSGMTAVREEEHVGGRVISSSREVYEACWRTLDATVGSGSAEMPVQGPENPAVPKVFITAWIDYTHKYGTAYQLTDGSAGVFFNDSTTMIMSPGRQHFDYISNRKGNVFSRKNHALQSFPTELDRKVYLMTYFEEYMTKTLERDVEWTWTDAERVRNMDFLVKYYRMKNAIVFKLSNDVLQFNFFDHTKILLTESASVVTFIGADYKLKTYPLSKLLRRAEKYGILHHIGEKVQAPRPEHQKTIDGLAFLFSKLDQCREILLGLCEKKKPGSSASSVAS